jgi:hypothetical protein
MPPRAEHNDCLRDVPGARPALACRRRRRNLGGRGAARGSARRCPPGKRHPASKSPPRSTRGGGTGARRATREAPPLRCPTESSVPATAGGGRRRGADKLGEGELHGIVAQRGEFGQRRASGPGRVSTAKGPGRWRSRSLRLLNLQTPRLVNGCSRAPAGAPARSAALRPSALHHAELGQAGDPRITVAFVAASGPGGRRLRPGAGRRAAAARACRRRGSASTAPPPRP